MAKLQEQLRHLGRNIFLIPVHIYRAVISPYLGPSCIYRPTCSAYMLEAVNKHGIFKGAVLGFARIFRCNRLFMGGVDPVPEAFSWHQIRNDYIIFHRPKKSKKTKKKESSPSPVEPTDPSTTL